MAQAKSKKMSMKEIKKVLKQEFPTTTHKLTVGNSVFEITIDNIFKERQINEVTSRFIWEISNHGLEKFDEEAIAILMMYYIIEEFTDIEFVEGIEKKVDMISDLVDLGLLQQIVAHLPEDQLEIVMENISKMLDSITDFVVKAKKIQEENEGITDEELIAKIAEL